MFLTSEDFGIEDFLKSLNFIAPAGTNVQYFITPLSGNLDGLNNVAGQAGFEIERNANNIDGVTDTQFYTRKNMASTQSFSQNKLNAYDMPNAMPREGNFGQLTDDMIITGGEVQSPAKINRVVSIVEKTSTHIDIQLKEDWMMFPAHTLFHCIKRRV